MFFAIILGILFIWITIKTEQSRERNPELVDAKPTAAGWFFGVSCLAGGIIYYLIKWGVLPS